MQITATRWPGAAEFAPDFVRAVFAAPSAGSAGARLTFAEILLEPDAEPKASAVPDAAITGGATQAGSDGAAARGCDDRPSPAMQTAEAAASWRRLATSDLVLLMPAEAPPYCPMALRGALRAVAKGGGSLVGIGPGMALLSALGLARPRDLPPSQDRTARAGKALLVPPRGPPVSGPTAAILLDWLARHVSPAEAESACARLGLGPGPVSGPVSGLASRPIPIGDTDAGAIRALMLSHLADPLPLPALAAALGLTARQLRMRCLRATGETPAHLYAALRLDHAQGLAISTRLPVPELARRAGFASPSSFTRAYRARFGAPPRGPSRVQT